MGELARKPGCPELPATPLDLLTPRPGEVSYTKLEKALWPAIGAGLAVICSSLVNNFFKRPYWAALPMHVLLGGGGYFLGTTWRDIKMAARAEDDAVLRHYISLHPEDFPPYERKRYRDVYEPFFPVR